MSQVDVKKIAEILAELAKELDNLEKAGQGLPTVVKNAVRMKGALRQLEVQFGDLDALN